MEAFLKRPVAGDRGEPAAGRGLLLVSWRAANDGFRRRRGRDRPTGARVGSAPDAFSPRRSTCTGTSPRRSRPPSTSCAAIIPTRTWTSRKRAAVRRGWVLLAMTCSSCPCDGLVARSHDGVRLGVQHALRSLSRFVALCSELWSIRGELLDFSIFQMQPWLDVSEPNSATVAIADDPEKAERYARDLAERLYGLRHAFTPKLSSIDFIIDRAEEPTASKPVILVDSADSPNAGAPGDSMAVARASARANDRRRGPPQWSAIPPRSRGPSRSASEASAEFAIGGHIDVSAVRIRAVGYVRSLHDGEFQQEFVGHGGRISRIGRSAVLRFGNLDVLVCQTIVSPGDPQLYRGFGIEPLMYDLVVVKANTSFRVGYAKIAGEIYEADTPGAAAPDLLRLSFRKLTGRHFPGRTTRRSRRGPASGGLLQPLRFANSPQLQLGISPEARRANTCGRHSVPATFPTHWMAKANSLGCGANVVGRAIRGLVSIFQCETAGAREFKVLREISSAPLSVSNETG